ncbi:MAG: class I SAM-dependent methyltransferase [Chloroflexota bacterium]|nr:MAG: class I SAM-dependent methyltransferase [Chloroflexota bacterium]
MNNYSQEWFDTFLAPMSTEQTAREIDFLARNLFQPIYQTVLDVCCGMGRHARELSKRGYRVTGVDVNEYALERARSVDSHTRYLLGDMRALDALGETFGAVLMLWQSFGYFDDAANEKIVRDIARILNPRGRFILDIYNRAFFETRLGERKIEIALRVIIETKTMNNNRLRVELDYGSARDAYEWQIFYPNEISALAARCGFREILRCANFGETIAVRSDIPRMQFVFEKT